MKRAGGDEEDMVRTHRPVLRHHGATLHDGQDVPLHALAGHVGASLEALAGDLVNLIEEDDTRVLCPLNGQRNDPVHVQHLFQLFFFENFPRLPHAHFAPLRPLRHHLPHHFLKVDAHLLHARVREHLHHCGLARVPNFDLHFAVVQFTRLQLLLEDLPRAGFRFLLGRLLRRRLVPRGRIHRAEHALSAGGPRRQEEVEQASFCPFMGFHITGLAHFLADKVYGDFSKIANQRLAVPANIADLRELRRLHLHEGRIDQTREPACDLGLPDARRPDHDDVLRSDLLAHFTAQPQPPPPVTQGDRDLLLGLALSDDVFVEFLDRLFRG